MSMFDLAKTSQLEKLFTTPRDARDAAWRDAFWAAAPNASLAALDPQVTYGPDGFPYFRLAIPDPGPFTVYSVEHIMPFALENGVGAVIFGSMHATQPEWVFSYGDLIAKKLYDSYAGEPGVQQAQERREIVKTERSVLVAAPSEEYLPHAARRAMARFLQEGVEVTKARIGLVLDPAVDPPRSIVIRLGPEGKGSDETIARTMRALTWFLPRTYGLITSSAFSDASLVELSQPFQ